MKKGILALLLYLVINPLSAAVVTYRFSGEITLSQRPELGIGDSFFIDLTFDNAVTPSTCWVENDCYRDQPLTDAHGRFGDSDLILNNLGNYAFVEMWDDRYSQLGTKDTFIFDYTFNIYNNFGSPNYNDARLGDAVISSMFFWVNDYSATLLNDFVLLGNTTRFDVDGADDTMLAINFTDHRPIQGRISGVSVVPVPAAFWLFISGALILTGFCKRNP